MSKNRNRAKTNKAQNSREYSITFKRNKNDYCLICNRRNGSFYAECSLRGFKALKRHTFHGNNGKLIFSYKYRSYKTWKYNRKTKWK